MSKVIQKIDSAKKVEECFQDKHGVKWSIIDKEDREGFFNSTTIRIKCAASINMHEDRIKLKENKKMHAVCPLCN